jgi:hypothetical protein
MLLLLRERLLLLISHLAVSREISGKKIVMAMGEAGLDRGKACKAIPESNRLRLMKTGHFWRPV